MLTHLARRLEGKKASCKDSVVFLLQVAPQKSLHMGLGPAWTRDEIEAPAATRDMGSWTASVYTAEQQARLNVDVNGQQCVSSAPMQSSQPGTGGADPAWSRGQLEKPEMMKDLGGWHARVFTPEQQARLGVDEEGNASSIASQPVRFSRERLLSVLRNKVATHG